MLTVHKIQAEYVRMTNWGAGFTCHGSANGCHRYCHYFFRNDQVEPTVLEELLEKHPNAKGFIFSFVDCLMDNATSLDEFTITPLSSGLGWVHHCPKFEP
jgi:hypothetical protein